jgi:hypothetical protein
MGGSYQMDWEINCTDGWRNSIFLDYYNLIFGFNASEADPQQKQEKVMANVQNMLVLLDEGVDPSLVATLAGLSLAALAFYAPVAEQILRETNRSLAGPEPKLSASDSELEATQKKNGATKATLKSLAKAFILLMILLAYTLTGDQVITPEILPGWPLQFVNTAIGADVVISAVLLTSAASFLVRGALAIGSHFDVTYEEEQRRLHDIRTVLDNLTRKS